MEESINRRDEGKTEYCMLGDGSLRNCELSLKEKKCDVSFKVLPDDTQKKAEEPNFEDHEVRSTRICSYDIIDQSLPYKKFNLLRRKQLLDNQLYNTGRWTKEEHIKFVEAIILHGNEWKQVQSYVKSRTSTQARSHAQKFFLKLKKCKSISSKECGIDMKFIQNISSGMNVDDYCKTLKMLHEAPFAKSNSKNEKTPIFSAQSSRQILSDNCKDELECSPHHIEQMASMMELKYPESINMLPLTENDILTRNPEYPSFLLNLNSNGYSLNDRQMPSKPDSSCKINKNSFKSKKIKMSPSSKESNSSISSMKHHGDLSEAINIYNFDMNVNIYNIDPSDTMPQPPSLFEKSVTFNHLGINEDENTNQGAFESAEIMLLNPRDFGLQSSYFMATKADCDLDSFLKTTFVENDIDNTGLVKLCSNEFQDLESKSQVFSFDQDLFV